MTQRCTQKIVQRNNSPNRGSERGGNLRISRICPVLFAIHEKAVYLGLECVSHLPSAAGEFDDITASGNPVYGKAICGEPVGYILNVGVRGSESGGEFRRSNPLLVVRL